jgi:VWFA-related protein
MSVIVQRRSLGSLNRIAAVVAIVLMNPTSLRAQQVPAPDIKVNVRLVTLDVVVTDKKGNPVTNLTKDDFAVYEDAQRQTIRTFEPPSAHLMPAAPDGKPRVVVTSAADLPKIGNAPVTLLVLDELNTPFSDMSFARQSLEKYLRAQPETLNQPTALLVASNTRFQLLQDYTQRRADVLAALKAHFPDYPWKMANGGNGGSGAVERIVQSLSSLLQIAEATRGTPGRKNVIWVGVNAPGVNLTSADPVTVREMTDVVKRVTQTLLATRVAVYYIDPTINSSATVGLMVPGESDEDSDSFADTDPFTADVNFDEFAPATGGKIFLSRNDVNNEIASSIDNGNTYYSVSYVPTNAREDAATFRNVKIKLKNPNLIATTREGYYPEGENANNIQSDPTLAATQRRSMLQMEMSQAAMGKMAYNGLSVTAEPSLDKKFWEIKVDGKNLSWTPEPNGKTVTEVTAMAVAFDEHSNGGGKSQSETRSKMLGHVSRELQSERKNDSVAGEVVFELPVEIPRGSTRVRLILRDAVSGRIGTFDAKP